MRSTATAAVLVAAALSLVTGAAPAAAGTLPAGRAGHDYQVVDLGTLGGPVSAAAAMNDRGEIVGWSLTAAGEQHPFLWRNGAMIDLRTHGGLMIAGAINNAGTVVGQTTTPAGAPHAALWRDGKLTDIGLSFPGEASAAADINDRGQVVGWAYTGYADVHGFLWEDGRVTDLGMREAVSVNNRGEIVGNVSGGADLAALWYRGALTPFSAPVTAVASINQRGWVVGRHRDPLGHSEVWLWRDGHLIQLGNGDPRFYRPVAMNDRGQVLISDRDWYPGGRFTLWQQGRSVDLASRGITPTGWGGIGPMDLNALNNSGQIAGSYYFAPNVYHAVLYR